MIVKELVLGQGQFFIIRGIHAELGLIGNLPILICTGKRTFVLKIGIVSVSCTFLMLAM